MIIPTLGERIDLLKLSLESIISQQPRPDIVLVCPLKNTAIVNMAKKLKIVMLEDPGSLTAAINTGIAYAKDKYDFIGWMGDDDLLSPNSLQTSVAALDNHPRATVAFGYCDYIDDDGHKIFTSMAGDLAPWIMTWGPDLVPLPGSLIRRSSLDKAGEYDVSLKYAMDLDMFLRLRKLGPFVNTKTVLASFRWHPTSTTVANRTGSLEEAAAVKRKYLPKYLRPFAPIWEVPVGIATRLAAHRVTSLARKKQQ